MKKIKIFSIVMLALPIIFSFNHEKKGLHSFSASGYPKGGTTPVFVGIPNRADSTSRLYLLINTGTAWALHKQEGIYTFTLSQNKFHFKLYQGIDSTELNRKPTYTSSGYMLGVHVIRAYPESGTDLSFIHSKQ